MTTSAPHRRWYRLTPARLFTGLLVVQVFLLLSERFRWFWFNEKKGWTVLIAVGVVGIAVLVMLIWGLVCLCLRWRFQFGVRSLLVCLLAVSVPLGWFAWELEKARRQREAVEAIVGMDGTVTYDYEVDEKWTPIDGVEPSGPAWLRELLGVDFFCTVVIVDCFFVEFGDKEAKYLLELTSLEKLLLVGTQITDNGLAHLNGMTNLETLWAVRTQITDEGLTHLKRMTKLKSLILVHTQITGTGFQHLRGLTNLRQIDLERSHVMDAGLAHLGERSQLQWLSLGSTDITDEGLQYLSGLSNLTHLNAERTKVTGEGVKELREALPTCNIYH
jgi:hypothetical protein